MECSFTLELLIQVKVLLLSYHFYQKKIVNRRKCLPEENAARVMLSQSACSLSKDHFHLRCRHTMRKPLPKELTRYLVRPIAHSFYDEPKILLQFPGFYYNFDENGNENPDKPKIASGKRKISAGEIHTSFHIKILRVLCMHVILLKLRSRPIACH